MSCADGASVGDVLRSSADALRCSWIGSVAEVDGRRAAQLRSGCDEQPQTAPGLVSPCTAAGEAKERRKPDCRGKTAITVAGSPASKDGGRTPVGGRRFELFQRGLT